jgi:glycosyltransferase involved in cell wall biosynthesis
VVAARNGAHQLPILFEALSQQTLPESEFEVIVVDDASSDETSAVIEASGIARAVRSDEPLGLPRARNVGIREAAGDLIALTDADTVPDRTWLELGVARMDETGADILSGGVSIPLDRPSIAALLDAMNWLDPERCVAGGFALGANIWTRRATFERWGLFREDGTPYGHDDAEWGKRATRGGARLVYAQDVHLTHPARARMRQVRRKAYALGHGFAHHRRPPLNTVAGLPPLFLRPTPYLPPRRIPLERLRRRGHDPTAAEAVLIYFSQWLFVDLAKLAGDFAGEIAYARERRRQRDSSSPAGDGPPQLAPRLAGSRSAQS